MARLIAALIRHGDYHQLANTPSAHQPFPLNEQGIEQAKQLSSLLVNQSNHLSCRIHSCIASSTLLRAWQTADTMATELNGEGLFSIQQHLELAERSVGSVANLSIDTIHQIIQQDPRYDELPENWKANSQYCLPFQGAESLLQAGKRVADFLNADMQQLAASNHGDEIKLYIGHGAAFRHAAYHLGILSYEQIAKLSMYHCQPVYIEYFSDHSWRQIAGEWKVRQKTDLVMD